MYGEGARAGLLLAANTTAGVTIVELLGQVAGPDWVKLATVAGQLAIVILNMYGVRVIRRRVRRRTGPAAPAQKK